VPRRGELRASALRATISCEIKGIGERKIHGAGYCDEIVNNALMENATGQSSRFQCLEVDDEKGGFKSVGCGLAPH
jgi:hypothetical protein